MPVALVLDRHGRDEFARDLVMRALQESAEPLELDRIVQRVNDLDVMGVAKGTVQRHLKDLVASGHVEAVSQRPTRYARTQRTYTDMDIDAPSLRALVGPDLYARLEAAGFEGLSDVLGRQSSFRERVQPGHRPGRSRAPPSSSTWSRPCWKTGQSETGAWSHTDLIGSPYPRPYQYEAYAVFRGYGYHGQLVEAPTGSGKTMIGMMCIQDWLQQPAIRPVDPDPGAHQQLPAAVDGRTVLQTDRPASLAGDGLCRHAQPAGALPEAHRQPSGHSADDLHRAGPGRIRGRQGWL